MRIVIYPRVVVEPGQQISDGTGVYQPFRSRHGTVHDSFPSNIGIIASQHELNLGYPLVLVLQTILSILILLQKKLSGDVMVLSNSCHLEALHGGSLRQLKGSPPIGVGMLYEDYRKVYTHHYDQSSAVR